jgi:hypothetical protein
MELLTLSPLLPLLGVGFHHPSILALELISVFILTRRFIAGEFVNFSSLLLFLLKSASFLGSGMNQSLRV